MGGTERPLSPIHFTVLGRVLTHKADLRRCILTLLTGHACPASMRLGVGLYPFCSMPGRLRIRSKPYAVRYRS